MTGIDEIAINFNETATTLMNILIGFIMFGVALDLKLSDFKYSLSKPKPVLIGLTCQFFLLPALTFLLVLIIQPMPSIALGMFLIAACPGGNLSNFLTYLAKGNTAVSITMSAISTSAAIIMTPLNLLVWSSFYAPTREILQTVRIDPLEILNIIVILLGIPLVLGMVVRAQLPLLADRAAPWVKRFGIIFFILFVAGALSSNFSLFLQYIGMVFFIILLMNAVALATGYGFAKLWGLPEQDRRAISIETGIQNSGLGLILVFNFFDGLGGAAFVAAWWSIWHILSGLTVATYWSRRSPKKFKGGLSA
ncbi:bile acid:sodium symporter family protein [Geomicrobium sp. JSM 1781026]|uniref:bile acid:sodium symporter family protein n=1 Tax=Geomicrobium sp. JSM 1781026 TaxID=3344580 RepID=UPI0035C16C80